jgi:hypothetical protein
MINMIGLAAALQSVAQLPPAPVAAAPVAPAIDWRVAEVAQGSWSWRSVPGGSEAVFQDYRGPQLTLRCSMAARTVSVARTGAISGAPLVVRTTSAERTLPSSGTLLATDPLLDDIAFSRGRFAVEVAGAQRLIAPAWPEAARAVEDCRK